jgi:hypothetical protein
MRSGRRYNAEMRRIRLTTGLAAALATVVLALALIAFSKGGSFLIIDHPEKSDAIVITQGDSLDDPYWFGMRLMNNGYGRELLVDARSNRIFFGRTQADWAGDFIAKTAANLPGQVRVCAIAGDTTAEEIYEVHDCFKGHPIHSVLLVVSDFHTRRSLAMFSRLLPNYHWSVAAVHDPMRFGDPWWRKRAWIRTGVVEWQHLLWWELIDRWRFTPEQAESSL